MPPSPVYLVATSLVAIWVSYLEGPKISYAIADASASKEILSSRSRFPKPVELYDKLEIYGPSVVTTEDEEWRKYRRLVAPGFTDRNNRFVWRESVRVVRELVGDVWGWKEDGGGQRVVVEHCNEITLAIALSVLGSAVFGAKTSWNQENEVAGGGHKLTFKKAIHDACGNIMMKAAIPDWLLGMGVSERLEGIRVSFEEVGVYMKEMLRERVESGDMDRDDLFSILLKNTRGEVKSETLDDVELFGNIFILLVAGHETTAHALCFAFALLALYQDEQEALYEHIKSVLPDGRDPDSVFNEALRLFPPVPWVPKYAAEDTTLVIGNPKGETKTIAIPKGTNLSVDMAGLHYNLLIYVTGVVGDAARYWKDPHAFKPERFLGEWDKDAFIPFSAGARACLGRKFSETEAVAVITMLIQKYKVTVLEEPQFASETFEQRKERVLATTGGVTLT
ncbi:614/534 cytochrome P450 [Coprinopsis cinerea okayama7|uniref:614/534 cytochrome P450 n=1 Tax=Coprinopsis cinerea (strain Okayama-7 / 130 / ATCC MYA-4618 / FGSC 9003) TaxID=240176 RepID=D6RP49_COPC7|nr:614/534 cytochrome P450 [Coprinopsis cinerea okayama7\|eukprot:XP_002910624.1 614/534 cytochrome P450 [Coprinopsis cinerea okayama7\